ncbi:MAG: hypothetical protein AABW47_02825 [Nanoarchaeota archaeon]
MKKQIVIKYKRKRIKVIAENCNFFKKISGLMFSRREKAGILLFDFKKKQNITIHSFFVFYPFVAIWLDKKNKIVEMKIVKPFNPYISSKKPVFKMIEIPINIKNKKILSLLDEN